MKNKKNLLISLSVSLVILASLFGIVSWGNPIMEKKQGGIRYLYYEDRDQFLHSQVEQLLIENEIDELKSYAQEYSFGYSITLKGGRPYVSYYPEGKSYDEMMKESETIYTFSTSDEAYNVKLFMLPDNVPVSAVWRYVYSHPFILFGGMLLWITIFVVAILLLKSIATPLYKIWFFFALLYGIECAILYYSDYGLSNTLLIANFIEKVILGIIATWYNNSAEKNITDAVNEKMKSERLKTELISNVSHDIKTPLTSIINFSDLIYKEQSENSKITEYAEHLHNQSVRMKDLMDSLIEATKASSGAIDIKMVPCKISTILGQCEIEYAEKLKQKDISMIISSTADDDCCIMADAKAMSRIMDNLFNNIAKYGMSGSRAYIETVLQDEKCTISIKNISSEPLNISGEELVERFVRGDMSRHSDGYGLGLSIVKSLMDLMNADLTISAKADVFEVNLSFDILEQQ